MTHKPARLVSLVSRLQGWKAGDILSTGTPRAVHIEDGDTAECRISGPDGFMMEPLINPVVDMKKSILVICQELFEEDFDMFFRKKGNFNRPSVYFTYNRMSVRLNIIFGVQLFAGVQLVFDQQSKNESY
ncbi:fumarylacetoacetate hydrolase family protein [Ruminococcus bicirculans (ex Wegman et al. 2014)]